MERILLNDFKRQWLDTKDGFLEATQRVGESGWYILGKEVTQFEADLGKYLGLEAAGCASGLDALELALHALHLPRGSKILTTPLSAFATTLAIIQAGHIPVFVDTDDFGLLDLNLCEALLEKDKSIRALLPVHLFGHSMDLQQLKTIQQKFGVKIIEDCAQAVGAAFDGKKVGSVGEVSATSFYPTKNLGCMGDGGAVLSSNADILRQVKILRDYGQSSKYQHDEIGMNSRLDEIHAGILRTVFLPKLDASTKKRVAIAKRYISEIKNPKLIVPGAPPKSGSVWHLFPILVEGGVQTGIHYPILISDQKALHSIPHHVDGKLTHAKKYAEKEVSLPIHPYLSDDEISRVVKAANAWK